MACAKSSSVQLVRHVQIVHFQLKQRARKVENFFLARKLSVWFLTFANSLLLSNAQPGTSKLQNNLRLLPLGQRADDLTNQNTCGVSAVVGDVFKFPSVGAIKFYVPLFQISHEHLAHDKFTRQPVEAFNHDASDGPTISGILLDLLQHRQENWAGLNACDAGDGLLELLQEDEPVLRAEIVDRLPLAVRPIPV